MLNTYSAQYFFQINYGGGLSGSGLSDVKLFDTDLERGNSEKEVLLTDATAAFEIFNGFNMPDSADFTVINGTPVYEGGEVSTTVTFDDGTSLENVMGLVDLGLVNLGPTSETYLLDMEALENLGKTLADVSSVEITDFVDHDLSFADLGFEGPENTDTPSLDYNFIRGSDASETVYGTDGNDQILGGAGAWENLYGGGGSDAFIFGADTRNGSRDADVIRDFDPANDTIVVADGGSVRRVYAVDNGDVIVHFHGRDQDVVRIKDVEGGVDAINIEYIESDFILA